MSLNKVQLIGRLGQDPEIRHMPSGDSVANFSVATSETWKDKKTGEKVEATEWHKCVLFGRLADIAGEYLQKGSQVYLEGKIKTRKWQDKDGNERYTTEIHCHDMRMLGGGSREGNNGGVAKPQQQSQPQQQPSSRKQSSFEDDDVPF